MAELLSGIKPKRSTPCIYPLLPSGTFYPPPPLKGRLTKAAALCGAAAAAVSVSTLSGPVLVLVTFLVFSHHLGGGSGLSLTFEAPSGSPLEELT